VSGDLFASAAQERLARRAPLADRLRPTRLDDVVGQEHLLGPDRPLRRLIEGDRLSSVILWGPPGTGKTTVARLIARVTAAEFTELSAVLDEVHRFNKAQQDALLPSVESGLLVLIGATTENPFFEVNAPLMSRSTLFRLEPLGPEAVRSLLKRGLAAEEVAADDDALDLLVDRSAGDGRHALTSLEVAAALTVGRGGDRVSMVDAEAALGTKALRYGRDEHFDVISAFIKSIRGSDVDAGLYWLARMLDAGEDARFIARRLVILASEDVGMADPISLVVADAAARAVEFVGLPEAGLNLAQAVVHLATAPKSNRVTVALGRAGVDARASGVGEVPMHLRDAHYRGAAQLGHGDGYRYPHDDPTGWVDQRHRPDEVEGNVYYDPSSHGAESEVAERMADRRQADRGAENDGRR
jgi:putative ATPase